VSHFQYERLGCEVYMLRSSFMMSLLSAIFDLCDSTLDSGTQIKGHFAFSDDLILFDLFVALL
jgi:hypothetical protein